jgi:hypothetical protein
VYTLPERIAAGKDFFPMGSTMKKQPKRDPAPVSDKALTHPENQCEGESEERGEDRRDVIDRRSGIDRRNVEAGTDTNLERRRGPGRRRTDFMRSAEEGEMSQEQFQFIMAIEAFKRVNGKSFPTWTDVLEVIRKLGYRKTMETELNLGPRVDDWTERFDAPSGVSKLAEEETEDDE